MDKNKYIEIWTNYTYRNYCYGTVEILEDETSEATILRIDSLLRRKLDVDSTYSLNKSKPRDLKKLCAFLEYKASKAYPHFKKNSRNGCKIFLRRVPSKDRSRRR